MRKFVEIVVAGFKIPNTIKNIEQIIKISQEELSLYASSDRIQAEVRWPLSHARNH